MEKEQFPETPEVEAAAIRNGLMLTDQQEIPLLMQQIYWKFKRHWDHVAHGMQMSLTAICFLVQTYWNSEKLEPPSPKKKKAPVRNNNSQITEAMTKFADTEHDADVLAWWRNHWRKSKYQGLTSDGKLVRVVVQDGTAEERELKPNHVKVALVEQTVG